MPSHTFKTKRKRKQTQKSVKAANNQLFGDVVDRADGSADTSGEIQDGDVASGTTITRDIPISAKDTSKQRAQDVEQGNDHREPREERIDSTQSPHLPQPFQPHNAAESAACTEEHYGSVGQLSTAPSVYRIPCIDRPHPTQKLKLWWPRNTDGSYVTLTELEIMIANLHIYSRNNVDTEWIALKPHWWLQMLSHMCEQTRSHAKIEEKRMESDMRDYRAMFSLKEAVALKWPMVGGQHWFRYELRNLLVD
jgi:hypothetical protein